jgi:hypothetical protein
VNKYYFVLCFASYYASYSSELAEYCFIIHSKNNLCSELNAQCLDLLTVDSSIIYKIERYDTLKCDYEFELDRKDVIYLPKNLVANYYDAYEARGCVGIGNYGDSKPIRCPVKIKLDIPVTFPEKITICEERESNHVGKKELYYNQAMDIKNLLGKNFIAEWKVKVECLPHYDTTFTGSYYIRITGECDSAFVSQRNRENVSDIDRVKFF